GTARRCGPGTRLGGGAQQNLIDGVESGSPGPRRVHPVVELDGDGPGDLDEVVGAMGELGGGHPEEGPGREGGEVDLDPGHRAAVPDVSRPQVQSGQEYIA